MNGSAILLDGLEPVIFELLAFSFWVGCAGRVPDVPARDEYFAGEWAKWLGLSVSARAIYQELARSLVSGIVVARITK